MKKGLKNGQVSIKDLDRATSMIVDEMLRSKVYRDLRGKNDK